MQCKNHPDVAATARCAGCAESFCDNCLVEIQGQRYCASCKVLALKAPIVVEGATETCKEARDALIMSIVGLLLCGIILGPMAISKASKAKHMIELNPRLTGSGMATAATIIGIVGIVFCVIGIFARVAMHH